MNLEQLLEQKLIDHKGLLILNYKSIGLDESMLACLLLLYKLNEQGLTCITPAHLEKYMSMNRKEIDSLLVLMIQKKYLHMDYTQATLMPNDNVIKELILNRYKINDIENQEPKTTSLFEHIEKEFGRSLSPIELSTLQQWYQVYGEQMIYNALKEAILSGVKNFRYIDRILVNWNQQGYQGSKFVQVDVSGEKLKDYDWLASSDD